MDISQQICFWAHMLDEAFGKDVFLTEGKHWPEDYIKTAFNAIKSSPIGQQPWYSDDYIKQDVQTFINEFAPLSHKSANLGFFMAIIRWFIEYSGSSKQKYQEFIERKLDGTIAALLKIRANKSYDTMTKQIKKMSFADFMKLAAEVTKKTSTNDIIKSDAKFNVIPIYSYEELHQRYGGSKTGYKGDSEWCHANGESTYSSWTKDGTQMFFVIEAENWQSIKAPAKKPQSCYDRYGMSLIAILVDAKTNKLLNSTSRWNHIVLPKSGAADIMFETWDQLNKAVGMDVESICKNECKDIAKKLQDEVENANREVAEILSKVDEINEDTIPRRLKNSMTKVGIPENVTSIGDNAFYSCRRLSSITIPNSVTSIEEAAFSNCTSLTSITIPNSVTSIRYQVFRDCSGLTNVMIPDSVKTINEYAFKSCSGLTSITIPDSVTNIRWHAFDDCSNLTSVTIPNSVTSIESSAFEYCRGLNSVLNLQRWF